MQSDGDEILDQVFQRAAGTAADTPEAKVFYKNIKDQCPQTVFHGTDVGHQHNTTGQEFLGYLKSKHQEDTEQYRLTQDAIEQGKRFYAKRDPVYRENMMVQNFIRELDKLGDQSIMGIYGASHTGIAAMNHTNTVKSMANQLNDYYKGAITSEDLTHLGKATEPERIDTILVKGKEYTASYYGVQSLTGFKDYASRQYWRLEDAYQDFQDSPKIGVLPYNNYPMLIEVGQVFVIDYTKTDGSVERTYSRSDGKLWNQMPTTEVIAVE